MIATTSARHAHRRLRILQVVPTYYPAVRYGGTLPSVHGLATALVKLGHEVSVFTTSVDGESDLEVPLETPVEMDGVSVYYFQVPSLRRLFWSPAMGRCLSQTIRDYDVVHLNSVYLWPTREAARVAARQHVPYVMTPHGMLVGDLIRRKNRLIKSAWLQLVERHSLKNAAAIHFTSEMEAREASAIGLPLPPQYVIPHGLDVPSDYVPLERGPFAHLKGPYALCLGRISWKKGIDRLINAWRWIPDLDLVIAGNDDENYLPYLKNLVEQNGLRDRIHFIGYADNEHKWSLYRNATIFALASDNENFGYVVAEAMAMACPVAISQGVGLASLVQQHDAGIIIESEPQSIAKSICALLADPHHMRAMGANGRLAVEQRLSWNAAAQQIEELYSDMLRTASAATNSLPIRKAD